MTPEEKQQQFYTELKELLKKYNAEISIEDFGKSCCTDEKIVVDFEWDEKLYTEHDTGTTPQLILGYSCH